MTIDDHINNFLRDAQYRVAQLSVTIDELEDTGSYLYKDFIRQRLELTTFMDVVYQGMWYITDSGYNHIQYGSADEQWTQGQIIAEIQRLRYYTNMDEVPFITFTAHYPQIINIIGSGGSGSGAVFPAGSPGDSIFYNISGQPYAEAIDPYAGMLDNESINTYFSGRL